MSAFWWSGFPGPELSLGNWLWLLISKVVAAFCSRLVDVLRACIGAPRPGCHEVVEHGNVVVKEMLHLRSIAVVGTKLERHLPWQHLCPHKCEKVAPNNQGLTRSANPFNTLNTEQSSSSWSCCCQAAQSMRASKHSSIGQWPSPDRNMWVLQFRVEV